MLFKKHTLGSLISLPFVFTAFIFITLVSCSHQRVTLDKDLEKAYQESLNLTSTNQLVEAEKSWAQFIRRHPTSPLTASAYFYRGYTNERLGNYAPAISYYKTALSMWGTKAKRDRAITHLRLAACHDGLGNNEMVIASLKDLRGLRQYLNRQEKDIELPARLALAYAKENNHQEANKYFQLANRNMGRYLKTNYSQNRLWAAEVLLRMSDGLLHINENFESFLEAAKQKQVFLTKAIELQVEPYSSLAFDRLKEIYEGARELIINQPRGSGLPAQRESELRIRDQITLWMDVLDMTVINYLPFSHEEAYYEKTLDLVDREKSFFVNYLMLPLPGQGLSPAAQEREGLRREGRPIPVNNIDRDIDKKSEIEEKTDNQGRKDPNL